MNTINDNINNKQVNIYISNRIDKYEMLERIKGIKKEDLVFKENGKPYVKSNPFYISFSDSKQYQLLVIAEFEIGCDIQYLTYNEKVLNRVCNNQEKALILDDESFTEMWVKKESMIKATGDGLSVDLKKIDTTQFNGKTYDYNNCKIAVIFKEDIKKESI